MPPQAQLRPSGSRLPRLGRLADAAVVSLAAAAAGIALSGGFVTRVWGLRVSFTPGWRLLGWALLVFILRHAWIRRPTLWQRLGSGGFFAGSGPLPAAPAPPATIRGRIAAHAVVIAGFSALTCAVMFQQVAHLRSVSDLGDPLFSMWRLDWVAYQLRHDPVHLFDANIFHPEPRTLAYSDAMLLPALVAAPWLWLGADVVVVHNLLLLAASAFSGVTMFWLVRSLTRTTEAAVVAGAVFALYPLRWAFHPNLELEITVFMPLALLGLHRTMADGRLRDGLVTGVAVALQTLSSLYYGLFLSVHLLIVGLSTAVAARARIRGAIRPLGAGALLAAAVVAPLTVPYFQNRATVGERRLADAARFSARPRDYLAAHPTSRAYGTVLRGQDGKLPLFPGIAPIALSIAGIWLPMNTGAIAYGAALGVSADASLGVNGTTYPVLYRLIFPFRGLRAPDRFAVLVGLSLAVLAGYGVARLVRNVQRRRMRMLITAGLVVVVALESAPNLRLTPVWQDVPSIYDSAGVGDDAVLVDLPFPQRDGSTEGEYSFLYFATVHHKRLVNGGSGFYPPWYDPLADLMRDFPNDRAIAELKRHGTGYLVLHGYFYRPGEYLKVATALDARPDVALRARGTWNGAECRLYEMLK
jgi:hypothetical protein